MIATNSQVATLASNPFATRFVRPGSLAYRFSATDDQDRADAQLREMVVRLGRHRTALIVGPHGSGKTTLLHALRPRLGVRYPQIAEVRLTAPPSEGIFVLFQHFRRTARLVRLQQSRLRRGGLLIVDGAEQLSVVELTRLRRRVLRRGQSMLATSHTPRWGMAIVRETEVNGDLVESLTGTLLANASPDVVKIVQRKLRTQDWTTLTNVRDLWFDMYDAVQPQITASFR